MARPRSRRRRRAARPHHPGSPRDAHSCHPRHPQAHQPHPPTLPILLHLEAAQPLVMPLTKPRSDRDHVHKDDPAQGRPRAQSRARPPGAPARPAGPLTPPALAAEVDDRDIDIDPALAACVQLALAGPHLAPPPQPATRPPLSAGSEQARWAHGGGSCRRREGQAGGRRDTEGARSTGEQQEREDGAVVEP